MENFKNKIIKAITICNIELTNRRNNIQGESTKEQLEKVIIPELNQLLEVINAQILPPKEQRFLNSFANAFSVWGWNMQNPTKLFVLLTELNNEYKYL